MLERLQALFPNLNWAFNLPNYTGLGKEGKVRITLEPDYLVLRVGRQTEEMRIYPQQLTDQQLLQHISDMKQKILMRVHTDLQDCITAQQLL